MLSFSLLSLASVLGTAEAIRHPKMELNLPMRDGIDLHTLIYFPRASSDETAKFTAIVDRSPYGYGDMEWITDLFLPFDFVAVGQDMRGTELSQGNFTMWQSDKWDSEDLGNWIVAQPWSNGKVYTLGASADGLGSLQTPMTNPSWLDAMYVIWAPDVMYNVLFPHGAYKEETTEDWLFGLTMPNPDVVYDNIDTVHQNEAHTPYWTGIESTPEVYANVHCPSAFYGGWYDLFISGTIGLFDGYNNMADESVRHTSKMTIDPLGHCLDGADFFTEEVVKGRTGLVLAQMLEVYGVRPVSRNNIKNLTFYVMSSNDDAGKEAGQYWTSLDTWPTPKMVDFFLHPDKSASVVPPKPDADAATSYVVDPASPVLTVGGNNLPPGIGGSIPCGPMNQAEVDARADVLTFDTTPFEHDFAMTGGLFATLYVSSDAVDTDFMVKISDLYPTGEAILIQDNAFRMRWRENGLKPVYMEKEQVYKIEMNLWNTSWVIAPGHSLRFSVQSSNNPRFSVNPQNGLLLADPAYPGENVTATNTLHHSLRYPSKITLPVVEKHLQLPKLHGVMKEVQAAFPSVTDDVVSKFYEGMTTRMQKKAQRNKELRSKK